LKSLGTGIEPAGLARAAAATGRDEVAIDKTEGRSGRTAHLFALMKKGDDAFNSRDFAGLMAVHHSELRHVWRSNLLSAGRAATR